MVVASFTVNKTKGYKGETSFVFTDTSTTDMEGGPALTYL